MKRRSTKRDVHPHHVRIALIPVGIDQRRPPKTLATNGRIDYGVATQIVKESGVNQDIRRGLALTMGAVFQAITDIGAQVVRRS